MSRLDNTVYSRLRSYSSAFSRHSFIDIIRYNDYSFLDWLYHSEESPSFGVTYLDYLQSIYQSLVKNHRCEYVYKNEVVNHLIRKYRSSSSAIFNEFRVGPSVADLALFNGESKAFEIKTEFDSDKRLLKQLHDYCSLFDKCYLVIPKEEYNHYVKLVDNHVGIISLSYSNRRIVLRQEREAIENSSFNVDIFMSCCRTMEYESFIVDRFGALPDVPVRYLYSSCCDLMRNVPTKELKRFFLSSVKKRKASLNGLKSIPSCLRQVCLSLNLKENESALLIEKLNCVIC